MWKHLQKKHWIFFVSKFKTSKFKRILQNPKTQKKKNKIKNKKNSSLIPPKKS